LADIGHRTVLDRTNKSDFSTSDSDHPLVCSVSVSDGCEQLDFSGFHAGFRPKAWNGVLTREMLSAPVETIFDDSYNSMADFMA
jgi:hypothetical protein